MKLHTNLLIPTMYYSAYIFYCCNNTIILSKAIFPSQTGSIRQGTIKELHLRAHNNRELPFSFLVKTVEFLRANNLVKQTKNKQKKTEKGVHYNGMVQFWLPQWNEYSIKLGDYKEEEVHSADDPKVKGGWTASPGWLSHVTETWRQ